ncbi:MAG: chemotaxis protein CheV [Burkholderiaceae bacterium]|nr:chemotaxis protein CheV [Burkholderiaceae bacterium]
MTTTGSDLKASHSAAVEPAGMTGINRFEMLLFRLGAKDGDERSEQYGISVFKVREIVPMPNVTKIAGALPHMMGVVNIRGQIIPVIDLPAMIGCRPKTGLNIMLVTEFARSAQAFAVEAVEEIVHLDWGQVLPAESGVGDGMVTSIARLDADVESSRLVQVLDVEAIMRHFAPPGSEEVKPENMGAKVSLKPGSAILFADDSAVARSLIEQSLEAIDAPYITTKSGKEAWERLQQIAADAQAEGKKARDKIAIVLTDLEMPEMDGFMLTKQIKRDDRFAGIPVVVHSSLTGMANEEHAKSVGADAYVAKFVAEELADAIRKVAIA